MRNKSGTKMEITVTFCLHSVSFVLLAYFQSAFPSNFIRLVFHYLEELVRIYTNESLQPKEKDANP